MDGGNKLVLYRYCKLVLDGSRHCCKSCKHMESFQHGPDRQGHPAPEPHWTKQDRGAVMRCVLYSDALSLVLPSFR